MCIKLTFIDSSRSGSVKVLGDLGSNGVTFCLHPPNSVVTVLQVMIYYCWYYFVKRWSLTSFHGDFSTKLALCCLLEENNEKQTTISADIEAVKEEKTHEQGREHLMSLIQVVQGHRAQRTLVDRSLGIHRSFLFSDTVQAALPQGAWRSMTQPLPVCMLQSALDLQPSALPVECRTSSPG